MYSGESLTINDRDYRLETVLAAGAGSYGQVWAATDAAGCAVALKFINAEAMAQVDPSLRGHWRAHLEREIVFLTGLDADQSRHIVTLIDAGLVDDQPVLIMERLQADLGQWLAQQQRDQAPPPDLAQILDWAEQILDGLEVVHRAGFVYRDLKFSNLLVGEDGALLKLADFGALKRENGDSTRSFIGTPATMAPEQALPVRQSLAGGCEYAVDYRADYYALGLLLFILLTGQPATAAQRRLGQLLALYGQEGAGQHREPLGGLEDQEREALRRAIEFWTAPVSTVPGGGVAGQLTELIAGLLACDPADRPQHGAAIRAMLKAASAGQPVLSALVPERIEPVIVLDQDPLPPVMVRRPSHRTKTATVSPWLRRGVGLASLLTVVGTVAWAILPPDLLSGSHRVETPAATVAPVKPEVAANPDPPLPPAPAMTAIPPLPPAPAMTSGPPPPPDLPAAPEPSATPESAARVTTLPEPAALPVADAPAADDQASAPPVVSAPPPALQPTATVRSPPARSAKSAREKPVAKITKAKPPAEPVEKTIKTAPVAIVPAAKPVLPSPAPATSEMTRKPPPVAKAAPTLRERKTPALGTRASRSSISATPPTLQPARPLDPPIRLVARAKPPARSGSRPAAPALPPIELESRPQSPPPLKLVSRSEPQSTAAPVRPPAPVTALVPPASRRNPAPPPVRSSDPVSQFQKDASRAAADLQREAAAIGNWASRAGKEVQRGLDSANRTVNQWTGNCGSANGCNRNPRVERRDRWADRTVGTVSQRPPPSPDDEESGFAEAPPQNYR